MKRAFILSIEDDTKIVGLQIAVAIQRESNDEKGVTFLSLSTDDIRENDEWLFKFNETAERIVTESKTNNEIVKVIPLEVLDKIRDEIEERIKINQYLNIDRTKALCWCLDVIDKYKEER